MTTMMKCGHAANGVRTGTDEPVCVICAGITPDALIVDTDPPSLEGRVMRCSYDHGSGCRNGRKGTMPSDPAAAFFEYRPSERFDTFYCGCFGWD